MRDDDSTAACFAPVGRSFAFRRLRRNKTGSGRDSNARAG